ARAAVLLRDRHAEHPQRPHQLERLAGHPSGLLPVRVVRDDFLLDEVAGQFPERLVVVGEDFTAHGASFSSVSCQARSSTTVALAVPPPSHMVCRPYRIPLARM